MKKWTFLKNALIMTLTSLILRTVGIFFRVYLSDKIGAEGMGLYQLIFSLYVLATTLATAGIPIAVTRLISESPTADRRTVRRILRRTVGVSVLVGLAAFAALFFGSDFISAVFLHDERAALPLRILSFGLPCMSAAACFKGYFIARRRVKSSSAALLFEQTVRMGLIFFLLGRYAPRGIAAACAAVVVGNAVSEAASTLYLFAAYRRDCRTIPAGGAPARSPILRKFAQIALPIAAGSWLNSLLRTIENLLVPDRLAVHTGSKEMGLSQFGMLKGMAMPLLFFPSSFLNSLSTLLVPEISEANVRRQDAKLHRTISRAIHITLSISVLLGALFCVYAYPLGQLLYKSDEVGFLLSVLAPIMPLIYLENIIDGILKGLNQQVSSLRYSLLDSASRIALIALIVPHEGIKGFLLVMIVSNLLTCFLNARRLFVVTGLPIRWGKWFCKPVLSALTAALLTRLAFGVEPLQSLPAFASMVLGALMLSALYALCLWITGGVRRDDLAPVRR